MSSNSTAIGVETRFAINDFLMAEAGMLDANQFELWLEQFTDDVIYTAPTRVTRKAGHPDVIDDITWYDENLHSLNLRVRRLLTDVAWAEDPRSMTRRFVTNLRIIPEDGGYVVVSNLMLFRSRSDEGRYDLVACERTDHIRETENGLRISSRSILIDQASLSTKNLGIFL